MTSRHRRQPALVTAAALLCGGLGLALPGRCGASEPDFDGQLQEIRVFVREKRYPLALESLRFIARQIQELRLEEIRALFPEPPAGWTASAPISLLDEREIWDLRVEARRSYVPADGGARIDVIIDLHSPLVPTVAMSFNPLFVAGDPQTRLIDVAGEQGLLRWAPDTGEGLVRVRVGSETLVTVSGRGIRSADPVIDLARRVDYPGLRSRANR